MWLPERQVIVYAFMRLYVHTHIHTHSFGKRPGISVCVCLSIMRISMARLPNGFWYAIRCDCSKISKSQFSMCAYVSVCWAFDDTLASRVKVIAKPNIKQWIAEKNWIKFDKHVVLGHMPIVRCWWFQSYLALPRIEYVCCKYTSGKLNWVNILFV